MFEIFDSTTRQHAELPVQPDGQVPCVHADCDGSLRSVAIWPGQPGPDIHEFQCDVCCFRCTAGLEDQPAVVLEACNHHG